MADQRAMDERPAESDPGSDGRRRQADAGVPVQGLAMGLADAVPGVSGGTVAFLLGIHPRLVAAIAGISPALAWRLMGADRAVAFRQADLGFLLRLALGIVLGLLLGARLIEAALHRWPVALMAVLLGLVAASIRAPARVPRWDPRDITWATATGLVAFAIAVIPGFQAPSALWFLPIAGAIAACAMILPGISGSYLLVLMGLYATVIGAVADLDLWIILLVGLGAVLGLLLFSRGLNHLLSRHRGPTHAAMVGLLAGSLIRLWPWRDTAGFAAGGPVMPDGMAPVAWIIVGALIGWLLDRRSLTQKA